jgi:protein phosphatase
MLKAFSATDVGKRRKVNQDYVYISEQPIGNLPNLFVVADGMGGHKAGDYASKVTVETMLREIEKSPEKNPIILMEKAICSANELIRRQAADVPEFEGMGTTIVAAVCIGGYLQVANVGDSRLYIVNDEMKQITKDHSLVEGMVRLGGLSRADARNHPDKNIITRAVGANDTVTPDFFTVALEDGDMVLMCSDGLTNMLTDEEIHARLKSAGDIKEKALDLIEAANENGGNDNISVVLFRFSA